MKYQFKTILLALSALLIFSCSEDDSFDSSEKGSINLFYDNSVNGDDLLLNTTGYKNSNNETLKISRFNYIVSNFVLTDDKGNNFTYPSADSYFIISEENNQLNVALTNIPAGNYTQITFGVGVPMERFLEGEEAQQEFWDYAKTFNMTWAWLVGYKFINFEGTYTAEGIEGSKNFKIHLGSLGDSQDNYREVTLDFPNTARVRANTTPEIHLVADANKILDGQSKIELAPLVNAGGTSQIMVDAARSPTVADNAIGMFTVDHIHSSATHE